MAPNYTAWQQQIYSANDFFNQLSQKARLEYLCSLGHLAPSTHNTQPWRFRIDADNVSIKVLVDKESILPASDVAGRQAIVSVGAAIENIILAAAFYGLKAASTLMLTDAALVVPANKSSKRFIPVADLQFEDVPPDVSLLSLVESIPRRLAMRAEFNPTLPLPESMVAALSVITDNETTKLHLVTDSLRRLSIAEFQAQADGFVINSKKFSRELGDWLLPNDTVSPVGMPGIGFGLHDEQALRLHEALCGRRPLEPEDGLKFALAGKVGLERSPLIGFITTKDDSVASWLAAGRALERIFLTVTNAGAQMAIHAGIVEVSLIKKIFSITLGTTRPITALFRVGFLKNPADAERPHAPRLPMDQIILPLES